ncbi:YbaB/EbfC family nucleoid-associated protein [Antrihabitans cavernicola]|uniref:YbaB/EbfC family nucleoid-associated protein n=1 Tax=Antrihabitans cavernicola TaxID=2495913 RepID=UPI001659BA06|nr:YbaB/EbfC family nucleoid-associated protein [Spelaeibacter cavernicola]
MDYLDDWNAEQRELAIKWRRKNADLRTALAAIEVRTTSPNGEIGVTVDGQGNVTNVRLTPQGLRVGDARLSQVMLETIQRAQGEARRKADEAARPYTSDPDAVTAKKALHDLLGNPPADE